MVERETAKIPAAMDNEGVCETPVNMLDSILVRDSERA
jgi:hypothetical protein